MRSTVLRHYALAIASTILFLISTSGPRAAEVKDDFGSDQHCLCFRGSPRAHCKSFFITETGLRFNFDRDQSGDKGAIVTELGWMRNVSRRDAVGVSLYQGLDGTAYRIGIRPRYRRWLHNDFAVDLSAGVLLYADGVDWFKDWGHTDTEADAPGLLASISLTAYDLVGFTLQYERLTVRRYNNVDGLNRTLVWTDRDDLYFGLTLGSYPGTPFVVAGTVLSVLALIDSGSD